MSDGGPAFPGPTGNGESFAEERLTPDGHKYTIHHQVGLSMRDWFAGQALVAWVGAYSNPNTLPFSRSYANEAAEMAYVLADAMLAARAVKPEGKP